MAMTKSALASRVTDIVLFLLPFFLIPWMKRDVPGPFEELFRSLGGHDSIGHGALAASILLVEIKYVAKALLSSAAHSEEERGDRLSSVGQASRRDRHLAFGKTTWRDCAIVIIMGCLVGAIGGFGGVLIGGLSALLILLYS
jgi:hypothetical protein